MSLGHGQVPRALGAARGYLSGGTVPGGYAYALRDGRHRVSVAKARAVTINAQIEAA